MNGSTFDRMTRLLARGASRRAVVAAAVALATARSHRALGKQLTPSTCGASGEVCTMLVGCCDGLTCVTSAINTNYGVCVPGEGGTVSIGTTLISPFSEEVEQEIAALAAGAEATDTTSTTTTTTTTEETEQETRIAAQKARKETRRTAKNTRQTTQKTEQQTRRETRRDARELRRGPKLGLELFSPGEPDGAETVRVTNRDDESVVLTRVEPVLAPRSGVDLTTSVFTLSPRESYLLISGITTPAGEDEFGWLQEAVCTGDEGAGILIMAAFSLSDANHDYVVLCDGSKSEDGEGKPNQKRRRRGPRGSNNGDNKRKNRNR